jgi:hypothetical protein
MYSFFNLPEINEIGDVLDAVPALVDRSTRSNRSIRAVSHTQLATFSAPRSPSASPDQPSHRDTTAQRQRAAFLRSQLDKPLEGRLTDAGLLSNAQLLLLQQDQTYQPDLTVEDILRLRGWFKETTLSFFLHLEQTVLPEFQTLSIGQRLKYAGLVDDAQLEIAIAYQQQTNIRLGHAIFLSGILSQTTVDYFVQL